MTAAAFVAFFMAAVESFSVMMSAHMVFTVVMSAAFIALMVSALMSFAVVMTAFVTFSVMIAMVVALGIRIIFQGAFSKRSRCSIRRSLYTGIELNSCVSKCRLCAHTDTSTDQSVSLCCLQEAGKCSMSASVGVNDLLINDLSLFNIVQFKLLGMAEVLKDFSVFVCDCDSHGIRSFLNDFLIDLDRYKYTMSTRDQQPFSVHKGISNFFPGAFIDGSYRGPGNVHPGCTDFLGKAFIIQQSQCLKFVYRHLNAFRGCDVIRRETAVDRKLLYSTASEWSWHRPSFLTYVRKYNKPDNDICQ